MINISDINKRHLSNPEPQEVKLMRDMVTSSFKDLEFLEGPHKYFLHNPDGTQIELPSVSSVIHQFEVEQDWDLIRERKAKKENIDPGDLKRQWREINLTSTNNGTRTHFFLENLVNFWIYGEAGLDPIVKKTQYEEGFMIPYNQKEKAGSSFIEFLLGQDNIYPIMPEARIYMGYNNTYNLRQNFCGTFDILIGKRTDSGLETILVDWKTNNSLISDYSRKVGKMLLPPFQDLYEEPLSMYTLQLSCYQMGLEQLGINVKDRCIIWLKDDGTYEVICVPNVIDRLKLIL